MDKVTRLASENGLVLFSKSSCCLCYAVKILFQEIGVTPTVHELDQDPEGREMERALMRLGCSAPVPAVFIGGKLVGSTNEVMSLHLSASNLMLYIRNLASISTAVNNFDLPYVRKLVVANKKIKKIKSRLGVKCFLKIDEFGV
ncbi:hypothetical protein Gotur_011660 [Gossypium turneri]